MGRIYIYNKKRVGVHTPSALLLWLGSRAIRARSLCYLFAVVSLVSGHRNLRLAVCVSMIDPPSPPSIGRGRGESIMLTHTVTERFQGSAICL